MPALFLLHLVGQESVGSTAALAGTGFAVGARHPEQLLTGAVEEALDKLRGQAVTAALCLFSPPLAAVQPSMLQTQMKRLACLQIAAATFPGVFTESGQSLGDAACAVLLLASPLGLSSNGQGTLSAPRLTWARPDQATAAPWLSAAPRIGSLSSRAGRFWLQTQSQCDPVVLGFRGVSTQYSVCSAGLRPLSTPLPVTAQEGSLLLQLERYLTLPMLAQHIPFHMRQESRLPLERLLIGEIRADTDPDAPPDLLHIRATDLNRSGLWLERPLSDDAHAFITLRDPVSAERDTRSALETLMNAMPSPAFAWISSSIGRDAAFFSGLDRDLELWRAHYPTLPTLGVYGMGELLPIQETSYFLRYSKVFSVFSAFTAQ